MRPTLRPAGASLRMVEGLPMCWWLPPPNGCSTGCRQREVLSVLGQLLPTHLTQRLPPHSRKPVHPACPCTLNTHCPFPGYSRSWPHHAHGANNFSLPCTCGRLGRPSGWACQCGHLRPPHLSGRSGIMPSPAHRTRLQRDPTSPPGSLSAPHPKPTTSGYIIARFPKA